MRSSACQPVTSICKDCSTYRSFRRRLSGRPVGLRSGRPHSERCLILRKATPNFNPQNVPDPQILPAKELSPEETVKVQLEALQNNDHPWPNHGIQTAYEFGYDIGGMERSRYFGYSKDLYHFDHFMGQFQNAFPDLVNLSAYTLGDAEEKDGGCIEVVADVKKGGKEQKLRFMLARKDIGRKKGALMTKSLSVV